MNYIISAQDSATEAFLKDHGPIEQKKAIQLYAEKGEHKEDWSGR